MKLGFSTMRPLPLLVTLACGLSACGGDTKPGESDDAGATDSGHQQAADAGMRDSQIPELPDAGEPDAAVDGAVASSDAGTDAGTDASNPLRPGLDARPKNITCVAWLASAAAPATLAETGCFDTLDPSKPVAALIPFEPIAPLWSDNADKQRWFALPDGATIQLGEDGDFLFPAGTVLAKSFALGAKRIETRLFVHHPAEGEVASHWAGYTYEWNAENTQATLLSDADYLANGKALEAVGEPAQGWHIPSRNQCQTCHTEAANRSLGLEVAQLDSALTYASTGRTANQLITLDALGVFDATTPLPPAEERHVLSAYVGSDPLDARARSYLHANCSGCHRPGSGAPGDLRRTTSLADTQFCNASAAILDVTWPPDTKRIFPGDATRSAMSVRMRTPGAAAGRMPPLGTAIVHPTGTTVIDAWINSLTACE